MITIRFLLTRIHYIILLLRLISFSQLTNVLHAIILFLIKSPHSTKVPPMMVLVLTTRCNYKCIMCLKNDSKIETLFNYQKPTELDFELLSGYLKENSNKIGLVRLHGGEPLTYRNLLPLISLLNEYKIPYTIITNGFALESHIIQKLVGTYCVEISISIDAATPSIYKKIRKGGDIATISKNLNNIHNQKEKLKTKRPIINASACTFSFNIDDISNLIAFCATHNVFSLSVAEGWDYKTPDVKPENLINHDTKRAELSLKKARTVAKSKGVILRTTFPSLYGKQSRIINSNVKPKNCVNLYTAPFILPDQIMLGCSGVSTSFGSIKDRSIEDIWNGPDSEFVSARKAFKNNTLPAPCSGCIYSGGFFS